MAAPHGIPYMTRPSTSDSQKPITSPYNTAYDLKHDIPLDSMSTEKIGMPVATVVPVPSTRSEELARARPKRKQLPLDRLFKVWSDQAVGVKALAIILVTGLPFVIFLLVCLFAVQKGTPVGSPEAHASITELAKWLLIAWGSFTGLMGFGRICATFSSWLCKQSNSWMGFERLGQAICLRIVLMIWAGVCYAVIPSIFHHTLGPNSSSTEINNWVIKLQEAFKFLLIAFSVIFAQGIVLELISIQYIEGWMGPRSQRASDELETITELQRLVKRHVGGDDIGILPKLLRKLFMPIDSQDLYYLISNGRGSEPLWKEYADKLWHSIAHGREELTRTDIGQQLHAMNRDPAEADDLFLQLDDSCDGKVTWDEFEKLVCRVGLQLNRRAQAQRGIKRLLRKLEIILSIIMLAIIVFIYVQFFEKNYEKTLGTLWTGIVGLSFAFNGAVLEFTNACVFVFGKHPYDIGDYVESKSKKLIVAQIFLTHTNFEEVSDPDQPGVVVQISHAALMAEPIINWTRTKEEVALASAANARAKGDKEAREKQEDRDLVLAKTLRLKSVDAL